MDSRLAHDWFPAPLPPNVRIGPRSWLYSSYAFLHYRSTQPCGVSIGHDTGLYNGTFFDLGPQGAVTIGDFCTLVGVVIATNGRVDIGDFAFLAHEVVIADSSVARPHTGCSGGTDSSADSGGTIVVGAGAWVGMRAVLLAGTSIGENAIVGAGAVVRDPIPANAIAVGQPARVVGRVGPE